MRLPLARAPLRSPSRAALVAPAPRAFASSSRAAAPASSSSSGSAAPSSAAADAARARKRAQTKQREWALVGASGVFAATGAWYLFSDGSSGSSKAAAPASSSGSRSSAATAAPVSFEITVRGPSGAHSRTITALTQRDADARLKTHETSTTVGRAACVVSRYDTNGVASNEPIEDRHAEAVVMRDAELAGADSKGDLAFFAVMDGHAGWATSELLKHQLIPSVAAELDAVFRASGEYAALAQSKAALPAKAWRALFGAPSGAPTDRLEADPAVVARALSKAFVALDSSITETPVALMKQYEAARIAATASGHGSELGPQPAPTPGSFASILPSSARALSPEAERAAALRRQGYEALLPAISGACALLTYVDSARGDVYVACTGDSRAVAGWWDEKAKRWEVEALSEDQMGRNPKEVQRMQNEHPAEERDAVIMRGRVLGGLEPTRAFGDARYKWSRELQGQLNTSLIPGGEYTVRPPPRALLTPPYVTARPEVTWRRTASKEGKQLRWIVMATDGLWDMLPTQEVGNLVSAHLDGTRGTYSATALQARLEGAATAAQSTAAADGDEAAAQQQLLAKRRTGHHPLNAGRENQYTFEDANLATHLIRNALGGADTDRLTSLLAIPAPESRRYRDDVTVSVILFNSSADTAGASAPAAAADKSATTAPKAKL